MKSNRCIKATLGVIVTLLLVIGIVSPIMAQDMRDIIDVPPGFKFGDYKEKPWQERRSM